MADVLLTSDVRAELVKIAWEIVQQSQYDPKVNQDVSKNVERTLALFKQAYEGLVSAEADVVNAARVRHKGS